MARQADRSQPCDTAEERESIASIDESKRRTSGRVVWLFSNCAKSLNLGKYHITVSDCMT